MRLPRLSDPQSRLCEGNSGQGTNRASVNTVGTIFFAIDFGPNGIGGIGALMNAVRALLRVIALRVTRNCNLNPGTRTGELGTGLLLR